MGNNAISDYSWYVPATVLSALWGEIMPKLAASVWKGKIAFPDPDGPSEPIGGGLVAYPMDGSILDQFWNQLAELVFTQVSNYRKLEDHLRKPPSKDGARFSTAQRSAHFALEYWDPTPTGGNTPAAEDRIRIRVIETTGYDFILYGSRDPDDGKLKGGLDVFVPPDPFEQNPDNTEEFFRLYKFRATGVPPIGLPKIPASPRDPGSGDYVIPMPLLTAGTSPSEIQSEWAQYMGPKVDWWITGNIFGRILSDLSRIIASIWYEDRVWPDSAEDHSSYRYRYRNEERRRLFEERLEGRLPAGMDIGLNKRWEGVADKKLAKDPPGWNRRDVMVTNKGLLLPRPGKAPTKDELLDAIEQGVAGNPVFTNSGECDGP